VVVLVALLGVITLGVSDVLLFMLPWILVGFLAGQVGAAGENPLLFILAAIVPHAILEVPALLLVVGAAMRWHAAVMARPPKGTISEQWVSSAADFWMVLLGLGLPLLLAAAYVEANITPQVILWAFGD
jgi:stage II sporulation protein M